MILETKNINKIPKMASTSKEESDFLAYFLGWGSWNRINNPLGDDIFERSLRDPYFFPSWQIETKTDVIDWPSLGEAKEDLSIPYSVSFISEIKEPDNTLIKKLLLAENGLTEVPDFESVDEVILFWSRQGNPLHEYLLSENNAVSEDTLVKLLMEDFKTADKVIPRGSTLLRKGRISTQNFIKLVDEGKLGADLTYYLKESEEVPEEVLIRWKNESKKLNWMSLQWNVQNYKNEEFKRDIEEGCIQYLSDRSPTSSQNQLPLYNSLKLEDVD